MTTGPTPKTFTGTSGLNNWADSYRRGYGDHYTDAWGNFADSVVFDKQDIPKTANFAADPWGDLNDSLAVSKLDIPKTANFPDDAWATLADQAFTYNRGYSLLLDTDSAANLADKDLATLGRYFTYISSEWNTWGDSLGVTRGVCLTAAPAADSLDNWGDSLGVQLSIAASFDADNQNQYSDSFSSATIGDWQVQFKECYNHLADDFDWNPGMLYASSVSAVVGTIATGTVKNTWDPNAEKLVIESTAGTPAFTVNFPFGEVVAVDDSIISLYLQGNFTGSPSEHVKLKQYNYNTTEYDNLTPTANDLPGSQTEGIYLFPLYTDADHISGGQMLIRATQASAGNVNNKLKVQWLHGSKFAKVFYVDDAANFWGDSLAAVCMAPISVELSDSMNNWSDSLAAIPGVEFSGSDSLDQWVDSLAVIKDKLVSLSDTLDTWADTLTGFKDKNASFPADGLGQYADALSVKLDSALDLTSDLNAWADLLEVLKTKAVELSSSLDNWSDALAVTRTEQSSDIPVSLSDSLDAWADSLSATLGFSLATDADSLNNYADALGALFGGWQVSYTDCYDFLADSLAAEAGIPVSLTDAWENLADTFAANLDLLVSFTDPMGTMADLLEIDFEAPDLLVSFPEDSYNQWVDSLDVIKGRLVSLTDSLDAWADSLGVLKSKSYSFAADSMRNWTDEIDNIRLRFFASLTDSLDQWSDSLALIKGRLVSLSSSLNNWSDSLELSKGRLVSLSDSLDAWSDSISVAESLDPTFTDSLDAWADALAVTKADVGATPIEVQLSDSMDNWSDSKDVFFTFAAAFTDDLGGYSDSELVHVDCSAAPDTDSLDQWTDSLSVLLGQIFEATDSLGGYSDIDPEVFRAMVAEMADFLGAYTDVPPDVLLAHLVDIGPDSLDQFLDVLAITLENLTDKLVNLTDAMPIPADALMAFLALNVQLTDSLNNWGDSVRFGGVGYSAGVSDPEIVGVNRAGNFGMHIGAM